MDYNVNFPHLGIYLDHVGKNFEINGFTVAFYGCVIAFAIMCGIFMALHEAKRTGQKEDDYLDLAIFAVIFSIIGARTYYVVFQWDYYKEHLNEIPNIRLGGMAIYGAVIGAVLTVFAVSKYKKIKFGMMLDTGVLGLILGQIIGRWGNFFNREAFGDYTDGLFAMQLPVSAVRSGEITDLMKEHLVTLQGITYIQVHPTFLYEGLWNLGVFLLLNYYKKKKTFEGELFVLYLGFYGLGRFWVEALRTDQLQIGSTGIAVSQALSALLVLFCIGWEVYKRKTSPLSSTK